MRTLKKGMIGEDIKILQSFLGIAIDGNFGAKTELAVKKWQAEHNLVADGIVGPKTWSTMFKNKYVDDCVIYNPLNVHITKYLNRPIEYLAIHYTAGRSSSKGTAEAVKKVFEQRKASADFCVDDYDIVQFNPDLKNYYCWAVGDNKDVSTKGGSLYGKATNRNTISIEICSNLKEGLFSIPNHSGWYLSEASINNAVKLTKILMTKFNISFEKVVRHYDISGKLCPGILGWNNGRIYTTFGKITKEWNNSKEWEEFKNKLK